MPANPLPALASAAEGSRKLTDAEITAMAARSRLVRKIDERYKARMRAKRRREDEGGAELVPAPPKPPLLPAGLAALRAREAAP